MSQTLTPLTYKEFLKIKTVKQLEEQYQKRGFQGSQKKLIKKAQEEWKKICIDRAKELAQEPEEFLPETVAIENKTFHIYGLIHGLAGGDDKRYKEFVSKKIESLNHILFENGLNYFYAHNERAIIPDFMLFGIWGSFKIGLKVGLQFPLLVLALIKEIIKSPKKENRPAFMTCDPLYHGIDAETRRGLDDYPSLPVKIQVDLEMEAWDQNKNNPSYALVVPRSLLMAAFAHGYADSRKEASVNLVVGDLHCYEIVHFLKNLAKYQKHKIYETGYKIGSLANGGLKMRFVWEKIKHLFSAGFGGLFGFLPYFALVIFLLLAYTK